ncbi:MAG: YtzI protein [Bacilli bacterium]
MVLLIVSLIIVFFVSILTIITTNKAYNVKHTIDPHPDSKKPKEEKG